MNIEEFNQLRKAEKPLVVVFYASWCASSQVMTSYLIELKKQLGDRVCIIKINIDDPVNTPFVQAFHIQNVPTLLIFYNDLLRWRHTGVVRSRRLAEVLRPFI